MLSPKRSKIETLLWFGLTWFRVASSTGSVRLRSLGPSYQEHLRGSRGVGVSAALEDLEAHSDFPVVPAGLNSIPDINLGHRLFLDSHIWFSESTFEIKIENL
jgi:hypothetical protein